MNYDNRDEILKDLVIKRLETTMIGCLARFEDIFGYLWGQDQDYNKQLTEQQVYFKNMWSDVRNSILNHGNNQIRAALDDIRKVSNNGQQKFHYKFYLNNKEDRRYEN